MRPIYSFEIETNLANKKVFVYKIEQENFKASSSDIRIISKNCLKTIYSEIKHNRLKILLFDREEKIDQLLKIFLFIICEKKYFKKIKTIIQENHFVFSTSYDLTHNYFMNHIFRIVKCTIKYMSIIYFPETDYITNYYLLEEINLSIPKDLEEIPTNNININNSNLSYYSEKYYLFYSDALDYQLECSNVFNNKFYAKIRITFEIGILAMRTFKDKSYEKFHKDILHPLFNRQFLSKLEIHDKNEISDTSNKSSKSIKRTGIISRKRHLFYITDKVTNLEFFFDEYKQHNESDILIGLPNVFGIKSKIAYPYILNKLDCNLTNLINSISKFLDFKSVCISDLELENCDLDYFDERIKFISEEDNIEIDDKITQVEKVFEKKEYLKNIKFIFPVVNRILTLNKIENFFYLNNSNFVDNTEACYSSATNSMNKNNIILDDLNCNNTLVKVNTALSLLSCLAPSQSQDEEISGSFNQKNEKLNNVLKNFFDCEEIKQRENDKFNTTLQKADGTDHNINNNFIRNNNESFNNICNNSDISEIKDRFSIERKLNIFDYNKANYNNSKTNFIKISDDGEDKAIDVKNADLSSNNKLEKEYINNTQILLIPPSVDVPNEKTSYKTPDKQQVNSIIDLKILKDKSFNSSKNTAENLEYLAHEISEKMDLVSPSHYHDIKIVENNVCKTSFQQNIPTILNYNSKIAINRNNQKIRFINDNIYDNINKLQGNNHTSSLIINNQVININKSLFESEQSFNKKYCSLEGSYEKLGKQNNDIENQCLPKSYNSKNIIPNNKNKDNIFPNISLNICENFNICQNLDSSNLSSFEKSDQKITTSKNVSQFHLNLNNIKNANKMHKDSYETIHEKYSHEHSSRDALSVESNLELMSEPLSSAVIYEKLNNKQFSTNKNSLNLNFLSQQNLQVGANPFIAVYSNSHKKKNTFALEENKNTLQNFFSLIPQKQEDNCGLIIKSNQKESSCSPSLSESQFHMEVNESIAKFNLFNKQKNFTDYKMAKNFKSNFPLEDSSSQLNQNNHFISTLDKTSSLSKNIEKLNKRRYTTIGNDRLELSKLFDMELLKEINISRIQNSLEQKNVKKKLVYHNFEENSKKFKNLISNFPEEIFKDKSYIQYGLNSLSVDCLLHNGKTSINTNDFLYCIDYLICEFFSYWVYYFRNLKREEQEKKEHDIIEIKNQEEETKVKKSLLKPFNKEEILQQEFCETDYGDKNTTRRERKQREDYVKKAIKNANDHYFKSLENDIVTGNTDKRIKKVTFSIPNDRASIIQKLS